MAPPGVTHARVRVVGGGGGGGTGGGNWAQHGSAICGTLSLYCSGMGTGGGGGGYTEATISVTPWKNYAFSVGCGGTAGNPGQTGGTTSFAYEGGTLVAHGGTGGNSNLWAPAVGIGGIGATANGFNGTLPGNYFGYGGLSGADNSILPDFGKGGGNANLTLGVNSGGTSGETGRSGVIYITW